jgi:hypothetical protein
MSHFTRIQDLKQKECIANPSARFLLSKIYSESSVNAVEKSLQPSSANRAFSKSRKVIQQWMRRLQILPNVAESSLAILLSKSTSSKINLRSAVHS